MDALTVTILRQQLRLQLDNCLKEKIKQPSLRLIASNDLTDPKAKLFREIIDLITREDLSQQVSAAFNYEYNACLLSLFNEDFSDNS